MKKLFFLTMVCYLHLFTQDESIQVAVQSNKEKKVVIGVVTVGSVSHQLQSIVDRIGKDLQWSDQVSIMHAHTKELHFEKQLKTLFAEKNDDLIAVLFLSEHKKEIVWRLYDMQEYQMIAGEYEQQENIATNYLAHQISDKVWPYLFGCPSCFASKIAYSRQIWRKKHGKERPFKQIWIADFDGSNEILFIDAPTVSFAPRWNNDLDFPLLFFSQNTVSNVQLVLANMFGKEKVVCRFDGLNMQPSFSADGKLMVFCLSKDGTSQLYLSFIDSTKDKRVYERLTFNAGNNFAPCFINDQTIVFASDYATDKPQLYELDLRLKTMKAITDGGYCVCPSYSSVTGKLVYSRMMQGAMQLFLYDFKSEQHEQLTFDAGSKQEPCWSACGNYIVFGWSQGHLARIAQFNMKTKKTKFLTDQKDHCTYPSCSPVYNQCLGVLNR